MEASNRGRPRGAGSGEKPPQRTCVGCGRKASPRELVRLWLVAGQVAVDRARSGGRGAWLHADPACLSRAVRRKGFARAFRGSVSVDEVLLRRQLTADGRKD